MMAEILQAFDQNIINFLPNCSVVNQIIELGFDEKKGIVNEIGGYGSPISKYRLSLPMDLGKVFIQVKKSWVAHNCLNN